MNPFGGTDATLGRVGAVKVESTVRDRRAVLLARVEMRVRQKNIEVQRSVVLDSLSCRRKRDIQRGTRRTN